MNKLTVTLKQHTPLIHFQHDQEGATLRASEVKPKLDKFIISKLTEDKKAEGIRNGWIKENDGKTWLDYKLKIVPAAEDMRTFEMNTPENKWNRDTKRYETKMKYSPKYNKQIPVLSTYPMFFGNMDIDYETDEESLKKLRADYYLEMQMISKSMPIDTVCTGEIISGFFLNHNFGTRQSKGFGSYYVDEEDPLYVQPNSLYKFNIVLHVADDAQYEYNEYKSFFSNIELFYKTLRGGINLKDKDKNTIFYFKSLAYMYAKDVLNAKWDKRSIKEHFYNDHSDDNIKLSQNFDIRDMLGFSTNEQWLSFKDSIEKKVAIRRNGNLEFPRKEDNLPVDRMQSPLLFKPIYNDDGSYSVFLIFKDNDVNMSGFKQSQKICIYSKTKKDRFMIYIPQRFSMEDYFNYIFNILNFDISSHVDEIYQEREEYRILDDIYTQIKENLQ